MTFRIYSLTLAGSLLACSPTERSVPPPPAALAPAFRYLDSTLTRGARDTLRAWLPDSALALSFSLGMGIRNELGLWRGGPVADSLRAHGVQHPEDMSHVILLAYGPYLRGEAIDLAALIRHLPPPPKQEFEVLPDPATSSAAGARGATPSPPAP